MSEGIHWGYEGATGPHAWGDLDPSFAMCGIGTSQSPIDIANAVPQTLAAITFHYQPTRLAIVNNGHSIQVNYDAGSYLEVDDESGDAKSTHRFDLVQFHFHTPSEHTYAGVFSDLELHLVHRDRQGRFAIVGVMFDVGAENAALRPIWERMPTEAGPEQRLDDMVNARDLLPEDRLMYRYDGSLTTPPCSESVL